jgi:hypothetical protein
VQEDSALTPLKVQDLAGEAHGPSLPSECGEPQTSITWAGKLEFMMPGQLADATVPLDAAVPPEWNGYHHSPCRWIGHTRPGSGGGGGSVPIGRKVQSLL